MAANPLDNFPRPQAGDPQVSASLLRTMVEEILASRNINGAANSGSGSTSFAQQVRPPDPIFARVTDEASTAGFYEWEQVRPNLSTGEWETPSNGLTFENYHGEILIGGFDSNGFTPQGKIDRVYELREILAEDGTTNLIGVEVGASQWYYAKVTASSSIAAAITLAEVDSAGTAILGGREPTDAVTLDSRKGVPVDTLGLAIELAPTTTGGSVVTKFIYQQPASFGITLTQTGGSAGDSTTQCSFTYTVNDMLGNELDTAVNPTASPHLWQRPTVGLMLAATSGVATYETGELVILSINEMINFEACA